MKKSSRGMVHALEFGCQAPLRFFEHCSACPQFGENCKDLMLGKEILRGKKKLAYGSDGHDEGSVHASSFNCLTPLRYFEKSRSGCAHIGRCREEGLLLALLYEKKELTYEQKAPIEFPDLKEHDKPAKTRETKSEVYYVK